MEFLEGICQRKIRHSHSSRVLDEGTTGMKIRQSCVSHQHLTNHKFQKYHFNKFQRKLFRIKVLLKRLGLRGLSCVEKVGNHETPNIISHNDCYQVLAIVSLDILLFLF